MSILHKGDKVGFIACSDGRDRSKSNIYLTLENILAQFSVHAVYAKTFYAVGNTPFSGTPEERAAELAELYQDKEIKAVFDLSGGNAANELLPSINMEVIKENPKPFVGMSDLSVLNNALFTLTGVPNLHYQTTNLLGPDSAFQMELFTKVFLTDWHNPNELVTFPYTWLRGSSMEGTVIGGNARCFLKLAGTPYMPNPEDKLLFLESLGGGPAAIASYIAQLTQLGFLERCNGILLGTFTELEQSAGMPTAEELVLAATEKFGIPVAKTAKLGHGYDSHCLPIGMKLQL